MTTQTPPMQTENKPLPMSRGEKIFDWLVYGGIAGIGAFLATIPMTYWAKHGGGAKYFTSSGKWLEKLGLSAHSAEQALMTTALMQGGNLALLPVKWAENNKTNAVTNINELIGVKTDVVALEAEDKQTWGSIIKARLVAWGVVFASLKGAAHALGSDKFSAFEEGFAKHIVCKPFGKATHSHGQETKAFKYGKIAALDVFATAAASTLLYIQHIALYPAHCSISSTLLYIGSRIFAHWERQKEDVQQTAHIVRNPAESHPQKKVKAISIPSKRTPAEIIKAKSPDGSFADAAMHSRAGEQMQLGA